MADSTLSRLNYGHAGTPTFDSESRDWLFDRNFTAVTLEQIRIRGRCSIDAIHAPVQYPKISTSTRLTDAKRNAKALLRNYTQLAPAIEFLPDLAAASAAVVSATSHYDPLLGNLYSTGSITYLNTGAGFWSNPHRVAATATGEGGNVLRLGFLYQEALGWGIDKSVWIEGVTLKNTESGFWNNEAAPIQQVCFSESEDRSTLLAVRLLTKTVIFRPFYSQRLQPAAQSQCYRLSPSTINAHPILTLENAETGGAPHADVTFNPDFQLQFAVVDQNHIWSIWDINHKRTSVEYKLACLVQGPMTSLENAHSAGEDGWARILWVGDVNTILVCNRRQLNIIGIEGNSFTYLQCPAVVSRRSSDWILDAKRHPGSRDRFFILTSAKLYLMAVVTSSESMGSSVGPVGAQVMLSWRHYRGAEDFTLGISVSIFRDDELCVLLYSRLNSVTQTYIINKASSSVASLISSTDPVLLDLAVEGPGHTRQITMEPCRFQGDTTSITPSLGRTYLRRGLDFYKLLILRSDLSLHETILCATPNTRCRTSPCKKTVDDLFWTITHRTKGDLCLNGEFGEIDTFDPDGIEDMKEPISKLPMQVPKVKDGNALEMARRTVDHGPLYEALSRSSPREDREENLDVAGLVNLLQGLLPSIANTSQIPLGTLLDIADSKIDVLDVDQTSLTLQQLIPTVIQTHCHDVQVRRIGCAQSLHLGDDGQPTVTALYDEILQHWIAPLPAQVPIGLRQRNERLARRIATEVTLATTRIFYCDEQSIVIEGQPGLSESGGISVPILPSQPVGGSSHNWASSQPLQQPTSSGTPNPSSQLLASQQDSALQVSSLAGPINRLRRYLHFEDEASPHKAMSDGVNRLLSQWQLGTDPHTYDWQGHENAPRIKSITGLDEHQIEKARKRKERRARKQQRENDLAQAQPSSQSLTPLPTFTKPTIHIRSSPGPMRDAPRQHVPLPGASSQSQGFGSLPFPVHSQVEPGRFGGRPVEKKKKKNGRVSGF